MKEIWEDKYRHYDNEHDIENAFNELFSESKFKISFGGVSRYSGRDETGFDLEFTHTIDNIIENIDFKIYDWSYVSEYHIDCYYSEDQFVNGTFGDNPKYFHYDKYGKRQNNERLNKIYAIAKQMFPLVVKFIVYTQWNEEQANKYYEKAKKIIEK